MVAPSFRMRRTRRNIFCGIHSTHIETRRYFAQSMVRFRMLRQRDHHAVLAQYAGLLARNVSDGWAEPFGVIEGDVSNDRNERLDNVGRIKPAAHAHFEYRDIDFDFSKGRKPKRRHRLKEAGGRWQFSLIDKPARCVFHLKVEAGKIVVRNIGAVDTDAFVHAYQ